MKPRPLLALFEHRDSVATITLNRPVKRNALNRAMRSELHKAIALANDFPVTLLKANGSAFCAGIDIKEGYDVREASAEFLELIEAIYNNRSIFIALISGSALGGGMTLTNACDLAFATPDASFGMPEIQSGLYPGLVGPSSQLLIHKKHAAWMALTGEHISAEDAQKMGIINRALSPEHLYKEAQTIAKKLVSYSRETLQETKKALNSYPVDEDTRRRGAEMGARINEQLLEKRTIT